MRIDTLLPTTALEAGTALPHLGLRHYPGRDMSGFSRVEWQTASQTKRWGLYRQLGFFSSLSAADQVTYLEGVADFNALEAEVEAEILQDRTHRKLFGLQQEEDDTAFEFAYGGLSPRQQKEYDNWATIWESVLAGEPAPAPVAEQSTVDQPPVVELAPQAEQQPAAAAPKTLPGYARAIAAVLRVALYL